MHKHRGELYENQRRHHPFRKKTKKLSQVTLAAGICTQGTISNIENKNICDSLEILDAICKRLNLSLESVLDDNEEKN